MMLPSKELLSEVLSIDVIGNMKYSDYVLYVDIDVSTPTTRTVGINIYELAHKCKEWAFINGYTIWSNFKLTQIQNQYGSYELEVKGTEPEAIFKACEWVRKHKDKQ